MVHIKIVIGIFIFWIKDFFYIVNILANTAKFHKLSPYNIQALQEKKWEEFNELHLREISREKVEIIKETNTCPTIYN